MLGQANSQTRFFSAAWDDQRPRLLAAGVPERAEREREEDRRGVGYWRSILFCRLELGLQSPAFFGELSVLRFQIGDPLRLSLRASPLRLPFPHRLRTAPAQSRRFDRQPRSA